MPWTVEEKTFCVDSYFETKSMMTVQSRFKKKFNCRKYPDKKLMYRWVHKFRTYGTVLNLNAKGNRATHSGRRRSSRSAAIIDAVRASVLQNPHKSIRHRSKELGIPRETIRRILVQDLQPECDAHNRPSFMEKQPNVPSCPSTTEQHPTVISGDTNQPDTQD